MIPAGEPRLAGDDSEPPVRRGLAVRYTGRADGHRLENRLVRGRAANAFLGDGRRGSDFPQNLSKAWLDIARGRLGSETDQDGDLEYS